ncbi:MAG TPA: molybdopterin-dependent oxidoreductase [Bryobacteraceae bacterium]|nr:molybdopterin-dependent oxidoreductase [Bryobacteraceae bacterium]
MERRDFFKILGVSTAGAAAVGCGSKDSMIPLLVPEHNIPLGVEAWHPGVCTECAAGCGTIARVMGADREVEVKGEKVRQRIAAVKKLEGNPLDAVSGGHLCARGQAAVQALYHPDRLQGAMKRRGDKGKGDFASATWDEAVAAVADKIKAADPSRVVFLTGPNVGTRSAAIQAFLTAIKAPAATVCSLSDFAIERKAAEQALGWKGLPVYDIANATSVLGVGADFLGGWESPVYYMRQFGNFRRGRPGVRGHLLQAESRYSVTAQAADQWIPVRPGTEPQFIAAVARILIDAKLAPNANALPAAASQAFHSADVESILKTCGLEAKRTVPAIQQFGSSRLPVVLAGASAVHTNSLDAVIASHYLNLMLGAVGRQGGVLAPVGDVAVEGTPLSARLANAQVILVDQTNPAYTLPKGSGMQDALNKAAMVVSFAPVIDDTAAYADFILPDDHPLERSVVVMAAVSDRPSVAIAEPFVQPLYQTRAVEKTLGDIADKLGVTYSAPTPADVVKPMLKGDTTYADAARDGGIWLDPDPKPAPAKPGKDMSLNAAVFAGDAGQYPLLLQPYLSGKFHDGSGAHLPWMQELPLPASSAIWSVPAEIDPKTADSIGVVDGDRVRLESAQGSVEAPVFVNPAAIPGVVSMAIGAGHANYTRFGTGLGSNPLSILAPSVEAATGAIATGATRVKISRVSDEGGLIQFSVRKREEKRDAYR